MDFVGSLKIMKKTLAGFAFLLFFSLCSNMAAGEKFGSPFSKDYLKQGSQRNLKSAVPAAQQIPTTDTSLPPPTQSEPAPVTPSPAINPSLTQQEILSSSIQAPKQAIPVPPAPIVGPTLFKSPYDLKPPRIKVPDYEKRLQAALLAEYQAKISKKKKSLIDSILEETSKYGLLIVLGLVILVMIYAMRKEGKEPPYERPKPEDEKKDIWHEEF